MAGFDNETVYFQNIDPRGVTPVEPQMTTDGQLLIGSTGSNPKIGQITSSTLTIGYNDPNITLEPSGSALGQTLTGDNGGPISPTNGNWNIFSTPTNGIGTTGSGSTLTVSMATPYADGDFEFRSTLSGNTRQLLVSNTSDTADSQAKITTSVAGTNAGDTWIEHSVGSSRSYAQGIDNSDSDKLKLTTAAATTANPSTADPAWALTPGTGFVYDQTGATSFGIGFGGSPSTNYPLLLNKDLDGTYGINIRNTSSGTNAVAGIVLGNDTGSGGATITMPSSTFTFAAARDKLFINADRPNIDGIVYNVRSGQTHTFYDFLAGGGAALLTLSNTNGIVTGRKLDIGTNEIFSSRIIAPSAGAIGELIQSFVPLGSAVALTSNVEANIASISLTPGIWDIGASITFTSPSSSPTMSQLRISINNVSATLSGLIGSTDISMPGSIAPVTGTTNSYMNIPFARTSLTATTTWYAVARCIFSAGNVSAFGKIYATRVA